MSPAEIVTATICLILVIGTLGIVAALVLRQVKDKPRPLAEVVEAMGVRLKAVETGLDELEGSIRRAVQREAKARQREKVAEPEEAGLRDDVPAIDQMDDGLNMDPRRRFAS